MEYQKPINLLGNQTSQPSKFRITNCVEINDDSREIKLAKSNFRLKC